MYIPIANRLDEVGEYYFSKKLEEISQMRAKGISVINLGIGSPDGMPPKIAIKVAQEVIAHEKSHGYSSYRSSPELRSAISQWYQRAYGVGSNPHTEVLPLLGSKEGIFYLSMALLNAGDEVLVPNPGYPAYANTAKLIGAKVVYYDLKAEKGWLPDFNSLSSLVTDRTKLLWVNYPHMPTGVSVEQEMFDRLVNFAQKKGIFVVNDNPYGLVLNQAQPVSLLKSDPRFEVSAELNSMSKAFNMAGWRVGMLLGSESLIQATLQVKSNVDSGMFLPIQAAAAGALMMDQSEADVFHQTQNETYRNRRDIIFKIFDRLGFRYSRDQVGLFVWARAPDSVPDVMLYLNEILQKCHVFLVPGSTFGSNGARYARASLCSSQELLNDALSRLDRMVNP